MTEVEQMIDDCMKRESKMNDWEIGFIDSIHGKGSNLTQMQLASLNRIWEKVT